MKLYDSRGACSLAPHIVLHEAGLPFELARSDTKTRIAENGADFRTVNSNGYVPVLQLDNGELLTECPPSCSTWRIASPKRAPNVRPRWPR